MAKTFPFQCRVLGLFSGLGFPCVSGAMAKRIYPTSEVRGGSWEELPHTLGQGRQPGGPDSRVLDFLAQLSSRDGKGDLGDPPPTRPTVGVLQV